MCFSRTILVAETKFRVDDDCTVNNNDDGAEALTDAEIETIALFLALFAAINRTMRAAAIPLFFDSSIFQSKAIRKCKGSGLLLFLFLLL